VKSLKQIRTIHLLGHVVGIESHRHLESLEIKSPRPFESRSSERITAVDLRKDVCHMIIQIGDPDTRTHISEQFDFAIGEV